MMRLAKDVRRASGPDGTIVLHPARGTMFQTNSTGARILDLLDDGMPPHQIAEYLTCEFSIPFEVARADLSEFIAKLKVRQLVDPSNEGL